ncbi:MAG: hypothetical protein K2X44_02215, partial [Magnetospirillum sp.]|nr:hypothetical protein [Magnetospirillum sp.]
MDKAVSNPHRNTGMVLTALAVMAFMLSLLIPALYPDQDSLLGVPLAVLVVIWAFPLMQALLRGEPWA